MPSTPPLKVPIPTSEREVRDWRVLLARDLSTALISSDVLGTENQIEVTINDDNSVTLNISTGYVNGTSNQITVTFNADNSITLSLPQDIHTEATPTFAGLIIDILSAASNGLKITGAANQTAFLIQLFDNALNDIYHVWSTGHISNLAGMNSEAAQYGTGMLLHNYGESTPEHADIVGSYDHTGGAQEMLFTRTAGSTFTQSDADEGKWLISIDQSANIGATAEIKLFIDANNVVVDGSGWDTDLESQTWGIFKHPVFVAGDGNDIEFSVDGDGKFELFSYSFTGPVMSEIELDAAADDIDGLKIETEANGYNNVIGQRINYLSGDLQPAEVGANQVIQIDDSGATSADSSTQIACSVYITTNASDATKDAMVVLPGFDRALEVQGAEAEDPDYGYETTSGTSVDRVNSGGGGNDAFVNPAVNVQLFDSNGDDILIGSDSTFEIIQVILAIGSSKDLEFDFWYSQAGGNWTAFTPQADNTSGFLNSGDIVFLAADLAGWSKDNEDLDGNAITDAYYIAMTRTYAPNVAVLPTESYFKIYASQATGMNIDGQGFITPRIAADADAPNSSIYFSTDSGVLVFKDSGGVVNDLY